MSFSSKIEENIKEIKDKQNKLQIDIDDWKKDEMKKRHPKLWHSTYNNLFGQMTALNIRLKSFEDTLVLLFIEEQKNIKVAARVNELKESHNSSDSDKIISDWKENKKVINPSNLFFIII